MNDVISRQAAIDEIKEIYEWHDNVTKERIIEHLKNMPSAERKGKWINHYCDEDGYVDGTECSCCHEWWYMGGNLPNYCPNCGASMVRGEEE